VVARFGGQDFSSAEAQEVVFDEAPAADTFVFTSPDGRPPAPESEPTAQRIAIHEAARLAPFPVFVLGGMPELWASFAMYQPGRERPAQPPEVVLMYVAGDSSGTVLVYERPRDEPDFRRAGRASQWANAREVTRDGLTVDVLESDGGIAAVRLVRENTEIEITTADLSVESLVELATRLQPAPTEPPAV
jgi:hypothetical protein